MDLSSIAKLNPISVMPMDKRNIAKMREWASEHEQCVRQLTVRQQTIKFSAGTFPMSQPMGYKHATRSCLNSSGEEEVIEREEEEVIEEYDRNPKRR